jgi:hypothetical protein
MPSKAVHTSYDVISHDFEIQRNREKCAKRDEQIRNAKTDIDFVVKWGDVKYPKSFFRQYSWTKCLMYALCPCVPCTLCCLGFLDQEKDDKASYVAKIAKIEKESRLEIYAYGAGKIREVLRDGRPDVARNIAKMFIVDVELRRRLAGLDDVPTPADIIESHDIGVADWE